MKQLKIKDNQCKAKEDFFEIEAVVSHIVDRTLGQLGQDGVFVFPENIKVAEDLTKDQMILQSFNDKYVSGNVMGFLGVGDERLIIESRFSKGENDFFFQYLLERVLTFPNFIKLDTNANQDNKIFNLLLFLFPRYLKLATRKGLFKTYIRNQYNDGNVRGSIDVARHIRKNIPFVGNVAYSQREHAYDNYLIELIRHTIEYIKRKPYGRKLLNSVKDEVKLVEQATPGYRFGERKKIIDANQKNVIRHAYYYEYRILQQLSILILRNEQQQYGNGARKVYGILFDGAWLWEEYVNTLIGKKFYHPNNKTGDGAQRLFSGNYGLVYPDFIGKDENVRIIADAKYKPLDNIGNKDYHQILAYMFRFDAKKGYFLYPAVDEKPDLQFRLNQGTTYEKNIVPRENILVIKHGLKIPEDAKDYADFIAKMRVSEQEFCEGLLK